MEAMKMYRRRKRSRALAAGATLALGMLPMAGAVFGAKAGVPDDIGEIDANMAVTEADTRGLVWHSPASAPFRLAGFAWFDDDGVYRRLPLHPPAPIPDGVDRLAWHTSGGQVQFRSDATEIMLRVRLRAAAGRMAHMPATGESGFDLYIGGPSDRRYYTTSFFRVGVREYEVQLFSHREADMREFTVNFPLYNGVEDLQIGLPAEARIEPPSEYASNTRIVIYGGSTVQGACASRPGTGHMNIISRRLNREVINLGFSGSGKLEPEMARTIAGLPRPGVILIECERNSGLPLLTERLEPFIGILRAEHPDVPVLVLTANPRAREAHGVGVRSRLNNWQFMHDLVARLRAAGDRNVHFIDGSTLLGEDFHACTVDNSHPTDLGFRRMADGLVPILRGILEPAAP